MIFLGAPIGVPRVRATGAYFFVFHCDGAKNGVRLRIGVGLRFLLGYYVIFFFCLAICDIIKK